MSTINYTYNVIVDRFRQFAAGHFQLRRFTHGEISQADLEKEAEWPWLHVKPRAINYAPGTRTFSFEIFISDLPRDKEDKTGYQAESITDCSLIFQDLINEIYLGNMFGSNIELTRPVNSEPFVEQYTHTLTGVTGIIELNLDYDWSACSIPASWNYNTPTDSGTDGWGALQFIESLDQNGAFVSLLNDVEAPGNSYYYGTNAEGIKGWYAIVDNVGLTCETLPDCATIISILDDISALQSDVALKANTADLGATAFSNDYNDLDNLPTIPAAQVNSDWNATSGVAEILNKPTIPEQYNPTAGTGVSITGTYPNQTITNTAPDQVVALTAGTNIGVTGTYPNFTISNTQSLAGYVPTTRSITINGTTQDLSADRTFTIASNPGTVTSVAALTLGTTGTDLSSTVANSTSTPVITLNVPTASATNRGVLSSTDWSTFNGKQGALTLTTTGTSGASTLIGNTLNIPQYAGTNIYNADGSLTAARTLTLNTFVLTIAGTTSSRFFANGNVGIGTTTDAGFKLDVNGTTRLNGLSSINGVGVANTALAVYGNGNGAGNYLFRMYDASAVERFYLTASGNFKMSSATDTGTTGDDEKFRLALAFAPTSGTRNHYGLYITQTINQTGGANGITRGLYINPTLTAAADYRAIEITAGTTVLAPSVTARASLRIPSGTAPTSPVNGDIWFDGTNLQMRIGGVTRTFTLI